MKVRIYVTQEEIEEVRNRVFPYTYFSCPIAIATRKMFSYTFLHIQVFGNHLAFRHRKTIILPPEAVDWVKRFDNNEEVKPINFLVNIP